MNDRSEKEEGITRDGGEQRKCVPKYEHAAEERERNESQERGKRKH